MHAWPKLSARVQTNNRTESLLLDNDTRREPLLKLSGPRLVRFTHSSVAVLLARSPVAQQHGEIGSTDDSIAVEIGVARSKFAPRA